VSRLGRSKNQAKTVGMVVKNQNAPHSLVRITCLRYVYLLFDDENLSHAHAGVFVRRRKRNRTEVSFLMGLTTRVENGIARSRELFLFIVHAMAGRHIAAMARAWDFIVFRKRRSRPPLLRDRPMPNSCFIGNARRPHQDCQQNRDGHDAGDDMERAAI
jgi:hypothetical protein